MSAQTGYITYSSVCYGRTVLAEGFQTHGPFTIIARKLLDKINDEGRKQKRTFEIKEDEGYKYHILTDESDLICLCRAESSVLTRICFSFLNEICQKFRGTYEHEFRSGSELSFNDRFTRVLNDRMNFYSTNPNADTLNRLSAQIDGVTQKTKENLNTVLERGEQLEGLNDKLADLADTGTRFHKSAVAVNRKLWWKNAKVWILLFFVTGVVVAVVVVVLLIAVKTAVP